MARHSILTTLNEGGTREKYINGKWEVGSNYFLRKSTTVQEATHRKMSIILVIAQRALKRGRGIMRLRYMLLCHHKKQAVGVWDVW